MCVQSWQTEFSKGFLYIRIWVINYPFSFNRAGETTFKVEGPQSLVTKEAPSWLGATRKKIWEFQYPRLAKTPYNSSKCIINLQWTTIMIISTFRYMLPTKFQVSFQYLSMTMVLQYSKCFVLLYQKQMILNTKNIRSILWLYLHCFRLSWKEFYH